jgi:hypothetical protein
MRYASVVMIAALAAIAAPRSAPASEGRPAIPSEQGVRLVGRVGWLPYRCSDGPVYNFYHDALYHEPPAAFI